MNKQDIKKDKLATLKIETYTKQGKTKVSRDPEFVKVEIQGMVSKSRTRCKVKIIERGPGFDESQNKFVGVKRKTGWSRGECKDYGEVIDCHIKNLS